MDRTAGELRFSYAKTGPRMVPQTEPVSAVLAGILREPGNLLVIVGQKPGTRLSSLRNYWHSIWARAGRVDVRLHDCRYSYAPRVLALGEDLPTMGKLLGHPKISTTARYAHLARGSVKAAAERVSDSRDTDLDSLRTFRSRYDLCHSFEHCRSTEGLRIQARALHGVTTGELLEVHMDREELVYVDDDERPKAAPDSVAYAHAQALTIGTRQIASDRRDLIDSA